jgi:hypothetical protein
MLGGQTNSNLRLAVKVLMGGEEMKANGFAIIAQWMIIG